MLMNRLSVWTMSLPHRARLIDRITAKYYREFFSDLQDKTVLEIGCGHGFGAQVINKYFSPVKIIATDLDPRMVTSAKKNVTDPDITFEVADAVRLPYSDAGFDAAFVYGAIHHIPGPDWQRCLKEVHRVLAPFGKVFIYDQSIESFSGFFGLTRFFSSHPYNSMYKRGEFRNYLRSLGFKILKEADLGRYFIVVTEK